MGQDTDFGEKHVQRKYCDGKLGCAYRLELFFEVERSIFVTGLEANTVACYSLTFFDEIRFKGVNVPGCSEVEGFLGFQVSQGEELCSIADKGCLELVFDKALASPTEAVVFTGE